jgi:hypothetical protein
MRTFHLGHPKENHLLVVDNVSAHSYQLHCPLQNSTHIPYLHVGLLEEMLEPYDAYGGTLVFFIFFFHKMAYHSLYNVDAHTYVMVGLQYTRKRPNSGPN